MHNLTRMSCLMLLLDMGFGNRAISIGTDGNLNNIDNRFAKCSFSKSYLDMLLNILDLIIFGSVVRIKNRNTKRNGEYTKISHDEMMHRLSDFVKWMFGIDIWLYYMMNTSGFKVGISRETRNKQEKSMGIYLEPLLYIILTDMLYIDIFNKDKIGIKATGYGNVDMECLQSHLEAFLADVFKKEYIFQKMMYPITNSLVDVCYPIKQDDLYLNLKYEEIENISTEKLLTDFNALEVYEKAYNRYEEYRMFANKICHVMIKRNDIKTCNCKCIEMLWNMIIYYKIAYNTTIIRFDSGRDLAFRGYHYYIINLIYILEDMIRESYMDDFKITFDSNIKIFESL